MKNIIENYKYFPSFYYLCNDSGDTMCRKIYPSQKIENERGELCGTKEVDFIHAAFATNGIAVISVRRFRQYGQSA